MASATSQTPWHEVVQVRDDLKTGELSLAVFAADLYDVIMQRGQRRVYEDPAEFFALTYPTLNLRILVKDVVQRLDGNSDKAYRKLSVNYGGGKTHTLITLRHLVHDPAGLPDLPAVQEFKAHVGTDIPRARVAALCFDKIDVEKGVQTPGPDGSTRMLRHPWSILAYQLAGADGLELIHAEGRDDERETPPAEPLMVELLSTPQKDGLSTLVLLDEVLIYLRVLAEHDEGSRGRLVAFFQYLTQAVVKVDRCAMVASLLASDPRRHDSLGAELLLEVSEVFGRQMEEGASPVTGDDVAEVLRRRFFTPDSIRDSGSFRPHVTAAVGNIAAFDEETARGRQAAEDRFLQSYPFHPAITDIFYSRWTQLEGFQRTRGILRTFATALRDAEKWDTSPLVGSNVFLNEPGSDGLSDAAGDLASTASVDTNTGSPQEWRPILEGELLKARAIQSEATGLNHQEIEQAVMSVFLSSQPIGQKALTQELLVLLGAAKPDRIELEKGLQRWTELSWFLDEAEIGSNQVEGDRSGSLPAAWRLGNRPNLRQMHDDACRNRVSPALVESQLLEAIGKERSLTSGANGAGARVHTLPQRPSDVSDDGAFHYAVLGPTAASDSGRPSREARRFIDETTSPDRPRVHRNAIVLAVPSKDGLDAARNRIREHLGWLDVRDQLRNQTIDPIREQMLATETRSASRRIPDAIRQAYSIVVTVNEANEVHAFRISVTDDPLFTTIKADRRSRVQETAISSEALMPGGPYDLWREGEASRRVRALVEAFSQFPKLPKMLRSREILDTVSQGIRDGTWVGQLTRPDRTTKTFWRTEVDEHALSDQSLEVFLPEAATLSDVPPSLLNHQELPGLWSAEEITVQDVRNYFSGKHTITVPMEGYEDTLSIPGCDSSLVDKAISDAVSQGMLWMVNGPTTVLNEPVPPGTLNSTASLRPPPEPIEVQELTEIHIPEAWVDGKTNALAIMTTLSTRRGVNLPWHTIRAGIDAGISAGWLELSEGSAEWPSDKLGAQYVVLQVPQTPQPPVPPKPDGVLTAEATLEANGIQDLADQLPELLKAAIGSELKFSIRIELGGETSPESESVERINSLLSEVAAELELR